jgi:hypothetical protein
MRDLYHHHFLRRCSMTESPDAREGKSCALLSLQDATLKERQTRWIRVAEA